MNYPPPFPQGPLIPGSIMLNANQTIKGMVSDISSTGVSTTEFHSNQINIITPTTATGPILQNGTLSNLPSPTTVSSAVNKQYIDTAYNISNIQTGVQYRTGSSFNASPNLTFVEEDSIGSLIVNGTIQSSSAILSLNTLTGLSNPTSESGASTKYYVDNFNKKYINQISGTGSFTYTAAQVVNGIIFRIGLVTPINSNTTFNDIAVRNIDYFPTATQILTQLSTLGITPEIGTTFSFNLLNVNANSSVSLIIQGQSGGGVTFSPVDSPIYGGYQMTAKCIVTAVTTPAVLIFIEKNNFVSQQQFVIPGLNTPLWPILYNSPGIVSTVYRTDVQTLLPMNPITYTDNASVTYTYNDISGRLIVRSSTVNVIDTFVTSDTFLSNDFFTNYVSGLGFEFAIQNISASSTVSLSAASGWVLAQSVTIPAGYTGLFNLGVNSGVLTVYLIGLFDRT
jgi:hypothetical protein